MNLKTLNQGADGWEMNQTCFLATRVFKLPLCLQPQHEQRLPHLVLTNLRSRSTKVKPPTTLQQRYQAIHSSKKQRATNQSAATQDRSKTTQHERGHEWPRHVQRGNKRGISLNVDRVLSASYEVKSCASISN